MLCATKSSRALSSPFASPARARRTAKLAPHTDLVFDVEWVQLEITDLKEGVGKPAKRGSKVLVHGRP